MCFLSAFLLDFHDKFVDVGGPEVVSVEGEAICLARQLELLNCCPEIRASNMLDHTCSQHIEHYESVSVFRTPLLLGFLH